MHTIGKKRKTDSCNRYKLLLCYYINIVTILKLLLNIDITIPLYYWDVNCDNIICYNGKL